METEASSNSAAKVSVVVPTFNGELYVARCLKSIREQRHPVHEVIVVDDGSTDDTVEIIESFLGSVPLQLVRGEHRGNWVANTNKGLALVSGELVSILHQDDFWLPTRLQVVTRIFESEPSVGVVFHPAHFVDPEDRTLSLLRSPFHGAPGHLAREQLLNSLIVQNFIAIPTPMVRTEVLREAGPLDESLWFTADWDLWLRLARLTQWYYTPEPLAAFRVHWESQTVATQRSIDEYGVQYRAVQSRFYESLEGDPARVGHLKMLGAVSTEVNQALLALLRSRKMPSRRLLGEVLALGPWGWAELFKSSRIHERLGARLRLMMRSRTSSRWLRPSNQP